MTFQEFLAAVSEMAGDRHHSATVEVARSRKYYSGEQMTQVEWTAYIGRSRDGDSGECASWSGPNPEAVLAKMRGASEADVAMIGEVA